MPESCRFPSGQSNLLRERLARHRGSLFGNAAVQFSARIYTAALQLGVFALLGAVGSDAQLAAYAVGIAAAGIISTAVDAGSGLWVVREIASGHNLPRLHVPRIVMLAVSVIALVAAAFGHVVRFEALPWILVAGATMGTARLWRGVLWAHLRYAQDSVASVFETTVLLLGVLTVLILRVPGDAPLAAAAAAYGLGYLARWVMARKLVVRGDDYIGLKSWARQVYSYAGQAAVTSAQIQADLLLLGAIWVGPIAGVAAYALGMRFYYALGMPFEALGSAILPRIARGREIVWGRVLTIAFPAGIAALLAMLLLTSAGTVFGLSSAASAYLKSIGLILSVALPFRLSSYIFGAIVTGSGKQSSRFRSAGLGLATMIALDLWLIPSKGPIGAAMALVCADIVLAAGYIWAGRQAIRLANS